jgi:hypothetical protein
VISFSGQFVANKQKEEKIFFCSTGLVSESFEQAL